MKQRGQNTGKKAKRRETKERLALCKWFADNERLGLGALNETWGLKRPTQRRDR